MLEEAGQALLLGVEHGGRVIGDLTLAWTSAEHRSGELGWVLDPAHQGRGYATEAVAALLPLAFDGLGLHRVVARVDARNTASAGVARRLGMRQEAHLVENEWFKGEWTDELDFALLASEWRSYADAASAWSRSASRSSTSSMPTESRTRSAGTSSGDPATLACVIRPGCSISDSTPPSDSPSVNTCVAPHTVERLLLPAAQR